TPICLPFLSITASKLAPSFSQRTIVPPLASACAACCTAAGTSAALIVCSSCFSSFACAVTPNARPALITATVNRFFVFMSVKFGEDYKRFLQLRRFYWLSWLRNFRLRRSALGGRLRFGLDGLAPGRSRASLWRSMLFLMMLLLADFLGVRDVSWVSHQLI